MHCLQQQFHKIPDFPTVLKSSFWGPEASKVIYFLMFYFKIKCCFSAAFFHPEFLLHTNSLWPCLVQVRECCGQQSARQAAGTSMRKRVRYKHRYRNPAQTERFTHFCAKYMPAWWTYRTTTWTTTSNRVRITAVLPRHKEGREKFGAALLPNSCCHLIPAKDSIATSDSAHLAINRG